VIDRARKAQVVLESRGPPRSIAFMKMERQRGIARKRLDDPCAPCDLSLFYLSLK
jgi:hypothetical protein